MVTGIIMECNPLHSGHRHILNKAREIAGDGYVIVVLSGDYVQRGIPAIVSKEVRTRDVLEAGADLVLELPLPYATGAANYFAEGAVRMLTDLHVVTDLVFGSLTADMDLLHQAARLLDEESPAYKEALRTALSAGLSYPAARTRAATEVLGISLPANGNDVLGIEYIRALHQQDCDSRIQVHAIPRISTMSASTIRTTLLENQRSATRDAGTAIPQAGAGATHTGADIASHPGTEVAQTDADGASHRDTAATQTDADGDSHRDTAAADVSYYMSTRDLSEQLYYRLQILTGLAGECAAEDAAAALMDYQDVDHDLACRIVRLLPQYTDWDGFAGALKTRNVTYTRVSRALLHILLGICSRDVAALRDAGTIGYARVLGFRRSAGPLLSEIRSKADIPLIMSPSAGLADTSIREPFRRQLRRDLAASELYDQILMAHTTAAHGRICELTKQVIII